MSEADGHGEDVTLGTTIATALREHADSFPPGFRPGEHDPDSECPWGMGEVGWEGFAAAVLKVLTPFKITCHAEERDPIGGWHYCYRFPFHGGDHEDREYTWPQVDIGSKGPSDV